MDNKRISEIVSEEMIKQDANRYRDMMKILTIPKSIADELDENYNNNHSLAWFDSPLSQNILNWYDENHNNWNIANIYINSKSLGVDLVKVVEG